jgi:excisionase family DNA binding protein
MRTSAVRSETREVMDIRQASAYLGISPDSLYKYASEGFIPAFKLGNRWRFKKTRIDEWMDQQSSASLAVDQSTDAAPRQKKPVRAAR